MSETNLHTRFKSLAVDSLVNSSLHGVPRIFTNTSYLLKTMWFLISVAFFTFASCIIIVTIDEFYSYEVVTNINVLDERPASFPAISICNLNPLVREQASDFMQTIRAKNNLTNLMSEFASVSQFVLAINKLKSLVLSNAAVQTDDFKKSLSYDFNKTFVSCSFNGLACNEADFEWFFDLQYGNCYKFNGDNKKFITSTGKYQGLSIQAFLGAAPIKTPAISTTGLHIYIHHQSMTPTGGVDVSQAKETNIVIGRITEAKLGEPYNPCRTNLTQIDDFDSDYYRTVIRTNYTYRQSSCFKVCIQAKVNAQCQCSSLAFPEYSRNLPPCISRSQVKCFSDLQTEFHNQKPTDECLGRCPLECESISYSTAISSSAFPTDSYTMYLLNKSFVRSVKSDITAAELKDNMVAVNIYYDEMKVTSVTQLPKMQYQDLIGSIGGNLGLFLGLSLCSLLEVVEFLVKLLIEVCTTRRNQNCSNDLIK